MSGNAIFLANNLLATPYAKSTHGVLRGPSRYRVLAIIDPSCAGRDAGQVLDGRPRGIPVLHSVVQALEDRRIFRLTFPLDGAKIRQVITP